MQLALYQPDIAQNLGTLIRLCACLDTPLHVIEPCGFLLDDKRMRRAAMDYLDMATLTRHISWDAFQAQRQGRLLLLSTKASQDYTDFAYRPGDILLLGRESAGVPEAVHAAADARLRIGINPAARSLNVAVAGAMVLGEAIRQIRKAA